MGAIPKDAETCSTMSSGIDSTGGEMPEEEKALQQDQQGQAAVCAAANFVAPRSRLDEA